MSDYIIRGIDKTKSVRFFVARTTDIVQEIRNIHESSAVGSAAMGRLATMASLMGVDLKGPGDSVTLRIDGNGIGGKLIAVSDNEGNVRVHTTYPQADTAEKAPGKLDVATFVGRSGTISIIRDYGLKEPFTGVSEIVSGEIAEDFANYYFYSEQTPSIVSLGVLVDVDLSIKAAGGLLVQAMPGCHEEEIVKLEKAVQELPPISKMIDEGMTPEDILNEYFGELEVEILDKKEIEYRCNCSRDRVDGALISIGRKELTHMLEEDGEAEIVCDFCGKRYHYTKEDLERLIEISK